MHGPSKPPARLRYLPALDGLRGVAVLAVIGYHAELSFLPGGFLGVELFFVVSGFLITSLLLAERRSTGGIDLRRFWMRRARRLLPALALMLVAVAVMVRVFLPEELPGTRGDLLAAVGYVTNWHLLWSGQSYFESVGRPPLLQHLWSLAVEEQYYLLWPLAVSGLMAVGGRRALAIACGAGALASAALMWVLVDPAAPSRVYYGTDTRAGGLLVGGLLALTLIGVRPPRPERGARRVMDVVGLAAIVALGALFVATSEFDSSLYAGGFLRFAVITTTLLFVVAVPGTVTSRVLGWRPLVEIGLRSYGLYLWHWPVLQLTRPHLDVPLEGPELLALRLAITVALTEVSFRLVEQPLRNGAIGRWLDDERLRRATGAPIARWPARLAVGGAVVGLAAVAVAYVVAPAGPTAHELAAGSGLVQPVLASSGTRSAAGTTTTSTTVPTTTTTTAPTTTTTTAPPATTAAPVTPAADIADATPAPTTPEQPPAVPDGGTTVPPPIDAVPAEAPPPTPPPLPRPAHAVGDSVLLASSGAVTAAFGGQVTIDAVVGRQPWDGVAIIEAWAPAHPGVDLIVALGSNGIIRTEEVQRILAAAGPDRRVAFVTIAVPRRWEGPGNDAIRQVAAGHPNAVLVDWHAVVQGDRSLLRSDGVHPNPRGAEVLAGLIRAALP